MNANIKLNFLLFFFPDYSYYRLQLFPIAEGKSGPLTVEQLTKRVTALGGVQSGTFIVDCETYSSNASLGNIS